MPIPGIAAPLPSRCDLFPAGFHDTLTASKSLGRESSGNVVVGRFSRGPARKRPGRRGVRASARRCRRRGDLHRSRTLSTPLAAYLNHGKTSSRPIRGVARCAVDRRSDRLRRPAGGAARPAPRRRTSLRQYNARAALVLISPFGQTGPQADEPATDLTLFFASGIARLLTGQVDDWRRRRSARSANNPPSSAGSPRPVPACMRRWLRAPGAVDRRFDPGSAGDAGDDRAGAAPGSPARAGRASA